MKSQNFEFLRSKRAVLADLGAFAERYAHEDPASSLLKQRAFVEHAVTAIYGAYRLRPPFSDNLNDLMNAEPFRQSVPEVVQNKLHAVRKAGNHAAHPRRPITSQLSLDCLFQLFDIARWFHVQIDAGDRLDAPSYSAPPPQPEANGKAKEALEKLRLAEAKYDSVLATLEEETRKQLDAERAAAEHASQLAQLKEEGQKVASSLQFDEQKTRRRLIDQALLAAGWDVGADGANTEEVRQEVRLSGMPTPSGDGAADYVLYGDDGKPLAVIEAKKTAKDARIGAEQARMYAESLEQETGVRPVIFFTNGVDIFLWDDAQGYPYRKVYGFYSKDSLEYLTHQRTNKKALAAIEPNLAIANRMYQLEAVKRVCERFSTNFRKALLVQATGTGKTRVAISLCDVLMRAGWVKRILFLCDRRELRKQADRVFKEFMPGEPRVVVDSTTSSDRDKRIYLATYPAMMKCYEDFDVGFFDLVIADESHRSIYKKFGDPVTNPKGWEVKALGEVATLFAGNSLPPGVPFAGHPGGVLLLKVGDMNTPGNEVGISRAREWRESVGGGGVVAPAGAVVIPKRGGAIATNKKRVLLRPAALDPNLMAIAPGESLDLAYLRQWFDGVDLANLSNGSAVPQLNKKDLAPLQLPIPPFGEQKRFAAVTTAVHRIRVRAEEGVRSAEALFDGLLGRAFRAALERKSSP